MFKKLNLTTINKIHINMIFLGVLFCSASIFHLNLWFDESYSVGMASHNFAEIWSIGGHDVHPVLYYWVISLIGTVTGESIFAYRLFSLVCIAITGILGFTHVRKDFGDKAGFLFSFFVFFIPVASMFAGEIRMYSLAMLLVTLCAIYGYRIYKGDTSWKNWILFEVFSLGCLYTHYYGLMAAGLINVVMLLSFIKKRRWESTRRIIGLGILQFALYMPWLIYFTSQLKAITNGFWIQYVFPDTLIELACFQFRGNMKATTIPLIVSIVVYIYLIGKLIYLKIKKEKILPAVICMVLYLAIIIAAFILKEVLHTSILLDRYLFVVTGLYIFAICYILSKENNKLIITAVCTLTLVLSVISNMTAMKQNYGNGNMEQIKYLKSNIQEDDSIVYTDVMPGSVIAAHFPKNEQYFYNEANWGVEEAYKALGDNYHTEVDGDFIKDLSDRIWIVDGLDDHCYQTYFNNDDYNFISQEKYETTYHGYSYIITLVEKNK